MAIVRSADALESERIHNLDTAEAGALQSELENGFRDMLAVATHREVA
jgi:hypothetical protein